MTWPTANPCFRTVSCCVEKLVNGISINNTIFMFIALADLFAITTCFRLIMLCASIHLTPLQQKLYKFTDSAHEVY
jgi:hypothetical protein